MKKIFMILMCTTMLLGCMDKEVDISKKQIRNGIVYEVNQDKSFTGKFIAKYDNGQLKVSEEYIDGLANGTQISYYKNGQTKEELKYENGKPVGEYLSYYENGNIFCQGNYLEGKKEGVWKVYNEDNKLILTQTYKNGNLEDVKQYLIDVQSLQKELKNIFN